MVYKIPVKWMMSGMLDIDANSAEEATQKIKELSKEMAFAAPLPADGEYIAGSLDIDTSEKPIEVWDEMLVTGINYLYRDASNYKNFNHAFIRGHISDTQIREIMGCLPDSESFIPSDVGLPECRFDSWTEDDVPWFEISANSFENTSIPEDCSGNVLPLTVDELVEKFKAAKDKWLHMM